MTKEMSMTLTPEPAVKRARYNPELTLRASSSDLTAHEMTAAMNATMSVISDPCFSVLDKILSQETEEDDCAADSNEAQVPLKVSVLAISRKTDQKLAYCIPFLGKQI